MRIVLKLIRTLKNAAIIITKIEPNFIPVDKALILQPLFDFPLNLW